MTFKTVSTMETLIISFLTEILADSALAVESEQARVRARLTEFCGQEDGALNLSFPATRMDGTAVRARGQR